ncbi:MAG: Ig-like domain-containing protein, partial [Steroidobacteraceae bacterium]
MWHQENIGLILGVGLVILSALEPAAALPALPLPPTTLPNPLFNGNRDYYGSAATLSPDGSIAVVTVQAGNTVNVGGNGYGPATPPAVYLFQYAGGAWGTTPSFTVCDPSDVANTLCQTDSLPTDLFGSAVAVSAINSGTFFLVVSSPGGGQVGVAAVNYGVVYLFQCTAGPPATCISDPLATFSDPGQSANDNFGSSVAISPDGMTVLVGAPGPIGSTVSNATEPHPGSAYVYTASNGTWPSAAVPTPLTNPASACNAFGTAPNQETLCDTFGFAVALSGTGSNVWALIGAPGAAASNTGSLEPYEGQAFVFGNGSGSWSLVSTFTDPNTLPCNPQVPNRCDEFGTAVALSADGTKALIGAPNAEVPSNFMVGETGVANLYMQSNGSWQTVSAPTATFTNPETSNLYPAGYGGNPSYGGVGGFGSAVALSATGATLLVGLPDALEGTIGVGDVYGYGDTGQVSVYACTYATTATCLLNQTLVDPPSLPSGSPEDYFGTAVAISGDGNVVLATAPYTTVATSTNPVDLNGAAYVYGTPTALAAQATLSVALTSAPASVATGGSINYNFTVTDTSASVGAGSLTLTDTLPAGVTYKSSSGGAGGSCVTSTAGGATTVTCTLSTLAAKATGQPSITVIAGNAGTLTDNGSVLASGVAATSSNTVSTVVVAPPIANSGTLTTGENTAQSSTLTASDSGSTLPLTYAIVANPAHGKVTVTATTGAYTYTPDTGYHGADSFTFDASNGIATSAPATISITVSASQLTLSYSGPNGVPVTAGQQLTYTATVANIGSVPADNLVLSVSVPSGVTLVSYATPVGTCTGGSAVSCTLATLESAPWALTVVVSVNAADATGASIASSASLSLSNGASPAPVSASV